MQGQWGPSRVITVTREMLGVVAMNGHEVFLYAYTLDGGSKSVDVCDGRYIDFFKSTLAEKEMNTELEFDGVSWMFMDS